MASPSSAESLAIRAVDLRVRRGDRVVLPGISLEIPRGVVAGLLGPSGSGKTTLLRAVVGVQRIDGGEIEVLGLPAGTAELRSRVAYSTQEASVYTDLTVRENLRYFGCILNVPAGRVDEVIQTVGLTGNAESVVRDLSGGERSRASLAVAMLGRPDVLVLDEPTVGLDPLLRRDLWNTFHDLAGDGATLLVSSHVMDEADRCDRLVLLREGTIIADGTPDDVRAAAGETDLEDAFIVLAERR